jgi:hypothetical protein
VRVQPLEATPAHRGRRVKAYHEVEPAGGYRGPVGHCAAKQRIGNHDIADRCLPPPHGERSGLKQQDLPIPADQLRAKVVGIVIVGGSNRPTAMRCAFPCFAIRIVHADWAGYHLLYPACRKSQNRRRQSLVQRTSCDCAEGPAGGGMSAASQLRRACAPRRRRCRRSVARGLRAQHRHRSPRGVLARGRDRRRAT